MRYTVDKEEDVDDVVQKIYDNEGITVEITDDTTVEIWVDEGDYYQGSILIDVDKFSALVRYWLDHEGYDVVKRETIAPCLFCGGECIVIPALYPRFDNGKTDDFQHVHCPTCKYYGPRGNGRTEAIRLHNLIAWRK